jgi:hypothetical protein
MKFKPTLLVLTLISSILAMSAMCFGDTVRIMKGTEVPLIFDHAVSSKTAKKGDVIALHVAADVTIGERTLFKHGEKVTAVISEVQHRKNFGVNAKLRIKFNPIATTFGPLVDIEAKSKGKSTGSRTDEAAAISGGGALLLGPVGLVGGYFVVGKQVNIKKGDKLITEVQRDTDIVK